MIAGKPYAREKLDPIMDMIGVSFVDGILVQESKDHAQNLIYLTVLQYIIYAIIAVMGYISWSKEAKKNV